jgi:hypothetical protein
MRKGDRMKFVTFWRMQALDLSLTERMFFRDAIRTLQAWEIVNKEYAELELIKKILEMEINILPVSPLEEVADKQRGDLQKAERSFMRYEKTS